VPRPTTDDTRFRQWGRWIMVIHSEVEDALLRKTIFREVAKMIDANPKIQQHSAFYEWLAAVWADSGLMATRRQVDRDKRSVSLERLLTDILDHPHVLSRQRFVSLYAPEMQQFAHARFDLLVANGATHIDPGAVQGELKALRDGTGEVTRYGTKRVAHFDETALAKVPTFKELDDALDLIMKLFVRYLRLLRGLDYKEPVWTYDWKAIFREPWIPSDV